MSKLSLVLAVVVALCVSIFGCDGDTPSTPQTKPSPTMGTIVVNPSPDSLACTWQLTGPSSYSHSGTSDETLSSLTPGDYTLTWDAEPGWTTPSPASQTMSLAAGATATFLGTYTVAPSGPETVSDPNAPDGPATGIENQDLTYSATGAISNHDHALEYRFDWGDGSFSTWGVVAAQNSWATAGTYNIKAQARCIEHSAVESGWSDSTVVTITIFVPETVSVPDAPTGAATNQVGVSSAYSTAGAVSSYGDDLQYRFDWGDGQMSTWSVATSTTHSWAAVGSYDVKAQARCNDHRTVESAWSSATAVTITAAPAEVVSTPDPPAGPAAAETNTTLAYTASGAVSSFGHLVEYRFDWGNGQMTGWLNVLTVRSNIWNTAGSYDVKVQARCRTHTTIESAWSTATTVAISDPAEIIPSPPGAINGVTAGLLNDPYDYTAFHSVQTNLSHAIEGQFDWGDGTFSTWITSGPFTASHTWTTEGTYVVKYEARCSLHHNITASADSLVVTMTATAVETISKPGFVSYSYAKRNPEINLPISYNVYGGTSSLGHDQEVMVDWGDGTQSGWVPNLSAVIKTWTTPGTYGMIRQARCVDHPTVVSEWSDPIDIRPVAPETVNTPVAPPGPTVGNRNQNLTYTGRGGSSTWHPGTWIEYRFDWGDGSAITAWSADSLVVHKYTAIGDYEVKTQARCAFPGHGEPESGWSLPTTVSIVELVTIYQYGPEGPYFGPTNESITFEAYSAGRSDVGHLTFDYQFDWGDGTFSVWSSSMTADHSWTAAGTYDVYYRARCAVDTDAVSDWSSQYKRIEITSDPEAIETPDPPTHYPSTSHVLVGEEMQATVSGSFSNHGHPIEYQFDFGDGTTSPWTLGTPWSSFYQWTTPYTYTTPGTYGLIAKARCQTHPTVESAVSPTHTFEVYENITTPGTPTGPVVGTTGANLTYTTTASTSSEGHTIEYSFEYRRGTYTVVHSSAWSTALTDDYVFTQAGTYRIAVRARCATHTSAMTGYSGFLNSIVITDP